MLRRRESVHERHLDTEDHRVWADALDKRDRIDTVRCFGDHVQSWMAIDSELQHEPDRRVVIDQENLERSGRAQQSADSDRKMIQRRNQRLPHVHHPFVVDGASGTLVGAPIAIISNLLTGTQETKNAFESHKAKGSNRTIEAAPGIEPG
jgi:hypothetical protein